MRGGTASPSARARHQQLQPRLSAPSSLGNSVLNATAISALNSSSFISTAATNEQNIRVAARVRPKTPKEASVGTAVNVNELNLVEGCWPTEMIITSSNAIVHNGKQKFRFDAVFPEHATQEAVFEEVAAPLVRAVCSGLNAALFAYGQTGTGKTHTMLGEDIWMLASNPSKELSAKQRDTLENSEMRGVIPRAMKLLFLLLRDKQHKVSVSYLEIYNEKILDLLNPTSPEGLEIREDKQGNVQAVDCTVKRVSSVNEVFDYLWKGAKNRAVSSTDMNEHSSRSHTIFQVLVETRGMNGMPGTKAKLNLVDLAGSEKWRPHQLSEFSDQRIMEMTSINQSLSNLGNCVRGLLRPGKTHIPFRNSKLTRLLQDSLGGNALTGFVVTVSPSELAHEETISTLQFADRVKRVQVKAEVNTVETPESLMKKLEQELAKAREENKELRNKLEDALVHSGKKGKGENAENSWTAANDSSPSPSPVPMVTEVPAQGTKIGQMLQKCLVEQLPQDGKGGKDDSHLMLLSKPEKFLQDYHEHLKQRKSDSLLPAERLALVEWSLCLQSEDLGAFKTSMEEAQRELKAKEAHIATLSKQLGESKSALDAERTTTLQLQLEKEQFQQESEELRAKVVELEQRKQQAPPTTTIFLRNSTHSSAKPTASALKTPSITSATPRPSSVLSAPTPASSAPSIRSSEFVSSTTQRRSTPQVQTVGSQAATPAMPSPIPTSKNISFNSSRAYLLKPVSPATQVTNAPSASKVPAPPPPAPQSIQVWDRFVDQASGKPYYHCKETGQTTWKRPGNSTSSGAMIIVRGE